jgi:hypothetical protein
LIGIAVKQSENPSIVRLTETSAIIVAVALVAVILFTLLRRKSRGQ